MQKASRWFEETIRDMINKHRIQHHCNTFSNPAYPFIMESQLLRNCKQKIPFSMQFLLKVECLGFSSKWCQLVHPCITTIRFSILVNGTPFGYIVPSSEIHQGDLLSPYLFVLCTKVLSRLLLRKEIEGLLHSIMVGRKCPTVSHLIFADDLLLFCRADACELEVLKDCLNTYERWSSQPMSKSKTSIFGSKNASMERLEDLGRLLGVSTALDVLDYLGHKLQLRGKGNRSFDDVNDAGRTSYFDLACFAIYPSKQNEHGCCNYSGR